jgi:hypothetical protein
LLTGLREVYFDFTILGRDWDLVLDWRNARKRLETMRTQGDVGREREEILEAGNEREEGKGGFFAAFASN